MKKSGLSIWCLLFLIGSLSFQAKSQLPVWLDGGVGLGLPDGGNRFNTTVSHYPGFSFYLGAQTTWNENWFKLDSLIIGAELSTHHFNARNQVLEDNLHFNSLFVTLSRYFSVQNVKPFVNIGLGVSTMNTSGGAFVLSTGGVIRAGAYLVKPKYSPGFSIGYNAPWIAYHNTLTGFWELTLHLRLLSRFTLPHKVKNRASYESE